MFPVSESVYDVFLIYFVLTIFINYSEFEVSNIKHTKVNLSKNYSLC